MLTPSIGSSSFPIEDLSKLPVQALKMEFIEKSQNRKVPQMQKISGNTHLWVYLEPSKNQQDLREIKAPAVIKISGVITGIIEKMIDQGSQNFVKFGPTSEGTYYYEAPASDAREFFNAIIAVQKTEPYLRVPSSLFINVLKTTTSHYYITKKIARELEAEQSKRTRFSESAPTLEEYEELAESDLQKAVSLAVYFSSPWHIQRPLDFINNSSFKWLCKAKELAGEIALGNLVNFAAFFEHYQEIQYIDMFDDKFEEIREAAANVGKVTKLDMGIGTRFSNERAKNIGNFLMQSDQLKILNLRSNMSNGNELTNAMLNPIAMGLSENKSLEEICIQSPYVTDRGIKLILDNIKANPGLKIWRLNLAHCKITEISAQLIISLLTNQPQITSIDLSYTNIAPSWLKSIYRIAKENFHEMLHGEL